MIDEEKKVEETAEKPAEEAKTEEAENKSGGYGKRPFWQWVVIYLIAAAIIYGLVYYFVFAKKGAYSTGSGAPSTTQQQNY